MLETYENSPMLSISYLYRLLDDIYKKMVITHDLKTNHIIEPAIRYIENNYNKNIKIKTLEDICHISKSSLFSYFKSHTGVTPIEYKHNIMIQNAIDLLSNTSLSIEEISALTGFSSSNYFRKIFLKLTDKTPKQIR